MTNAFLDIETSQERRISVLGIYRPDRGCRQWVAPALPQKEIQEFMADVTHLYTFNGSRFDLPEIKKQLDLDLTENLKHTDLMYECWSRSLRGGLKKVEETLGIERETQGVNGYQAVILWDRYCRHGDQDSLDLLLHYNREDVENLEALGVCLKLLPAPPGFSSGSSIVGRRAE